MSDPQAKPDSGSGIDAVGVDPDFVTNDDNPEPDPATPGRTQTTPDDADHDDVLELPDQP